MDAYEAVKKVIGTRCSVRVFKVDPIPDEDLREILWAGIRAPTASAGEQWLFFVVRDEERKKKIYDLIIDAQREYLGKMLLNRWSDEQIEEYFKQVEREKTYWAPVYIFAYMDFRHRTLTDEYKEMEEKWALQSATIALGNMITAAWAKGIGSVWLGVPLMRAEKYDEVLGAPENTKLVGGLALGYPAVEPKPTKRRPLEETVDFL